MTEPKDMTKLEVEITTDWQLLIIKKQRKELAQAAHDLKLATAELDYLRNGYEALLEAANVPEQVTTAINKMVKSLPVAFQLLPVVSPLFDEIQKETVDNFVTGSFEYEGKHWVIVLQNTDGKSPAEYLAELRAENKKLKEDYQQLKELYEDVR